VDDCPTRDEIRRVIIETLADFAGTSIDEGALTEEEVDTSQTLYQTLYKQPSWNMGSPAHE
jgi:lipoate-protein ligase A